MFWKSTSGGCIITTKISSVKAKAKITPPNNVPKKAAAKLPPAHPPAVAAAVAAAPVSAPSPVAMDFMPPPTVVAQGFGASSDLMFLWEERRNESPLSSLFGPLFGQGGGAGGGS